MRNSKNTFLKMTVVVFGMLLLAANVAMAQVTVTLPTVVAKAGTTKTFALTVSDLAGQNVTSYDLSITGDATIARFDSVSVTGTLTATMVSSVNVTAGQINVSAAKATPLSGSGTLLYITATMLKAGSSSLTVTINFNDGTPAASMSNPSPRMVVPELAVILPETSVTDKVDAVRMVAVTTEDVSGKGAYSYDCTITYDPTIITVTGVDVAGTLSSAMQVVSNTSTAGTLVVSAAGSAALTGAGTLFNIKAALKKAGESPLTFQSFQYNDGTPAAGSVDGKLTVVINTTAVNMTAVPTEYELLSAYPNPFNPTTNLTFAMPKEGAVTLEVYNVLGMKVRTLEAGKRMSAGYHTLVWDGRDNSGSILPSGVYIYRLSADQYTASKKMVMMK